MAGTPHKQMGFTTTVVALVNGMIGGSILVLPLVSLQAGWVDSIFVILVTGVFSYYSCYLSIIHLGDQKDLDHALLRHFNGSKFLKIFYDFCVWSGILLLLTLYFQLIVIQWQGLIPPYKPSIVNPCVNGVFLIIWCFCLKFFQVGAHIMGYGVISIVGYLLFLIWVVAAAPAGNNTVPATGSGISSFAAMMGNAFSIQGFFIPVMKCHKNEAKHKFILFLAFLSGGLAYYYIAFMGSFGIVNRTNYTDSQTIEGFFNSNQWEVKILQGIYLIHLYSVFPEYLLVSKKRFFSMFGLEQSKQRKINIAEIIYMSVTITICLFIGIFNVNIDIIIDINGAVLGFCFVYFLPSILHIKCLYFSKGKRLLSLQFQENQKLIKTPEGFNFQRQQKPEIQLQQPVQYEQIVSQKQNDKQFDQKAEQKLNVVLMDGKLTFGNKLDAKKQQQQIDYSYFYCGFQKPNKIRQIVDISLVTIMFLMGVFIMVDGLISVVALIRG